MLPRSRHRSPSSVQNVIVNFSHDIQDIIPYSDAVSQIRQLLAEKGDGEYVGDDMAIDGGDAEALLCGHSADQIFDTILPVLRVLSFMKGARVTLVYGPIDGQSPQKTIEL